MRRNWNQVRVQCVKVEEIELISFRNFQQHVEQTLADKDSAPPDSSASSMSGRTDRHRTAFFTQFRTESAKRAESRQIESEQKIQTEFRHRTDTGHDFPDNPDKNETWTGHGQCCPPTSVVESSRP